MRTIPVALRCRLPLLGLAACLALGAGAVRASPALAAKGGCVACHAVDKKMVGPSYKEIAARYKGDKSALATLSQRVRQGGKGVWGQVPMPATPADKLGDADLKSLVEWVLKGGG